jgi:hypothetical protein
VITQSPNFCASESLVQPAAYKRYLLVLLTIVMVHNYVDRLALGLLLQDIKADLGLTDTQLGSYPALHSHFSTLSWESQLPAGLIAAIA